jgi:hypothetical protein
VITVGRSKWRTSRSSATAGADHHDASSPGRRGPGLRRGDVDG